jgi:hypothetical protein
VDPRAGSDAIETIKISGPCRELNPGRPAGILVTVPTELSHMLVSYLGRRQNILTEVPRVLSQSTETNS